MKRFYEPNSRLRGIKNERDDHDPLTSETEKGLISDRNYNKNTVGQNNHQFDNKNIVTIKIPKKFDNNVDLRQRNPSLPLKVEPPNPDENRYNRKRSSSLAQSQIIDSNLYGSQSKLNHKLVSEKGNIRTGRLIRDIPHESTDIQNREYNIKISQMKDDILKKRPQKKIENDNLSEIDNKSIKSQVSQVSIKSQNKSTKNVKKNTGGVVI